MAFTSTVDGEVPWGGRRWTYGSFTNTDSSTGGSVKTGLIHIEGFQMVVNGSGVAADQCVVTDTFPIRVDGVTIVTTADVDGYWKAVGY